MSYDLGTASKRWRSVYSSALTGSLTKLSTGGDYLLAGAGISLSTGSSGAVTITATVAGSSLIGGSDTQVQFNDNNTFGGSNLLTFNKVTGALTGAFVVASNGFSGSLTKLSNGSDYLVAGTGISLTTGSSGNVTIASTAVTSPGGLDTHVQFKDGSTFGGNSGLTYNKTAQALTGTYIVASTGFSGSLTKLSTGGDYLVAGTGIQLSTGSSGAITIASSVAGSSFVSGLDTQVQFNDGGNFGADSNLTFNKATQTLKSTNLSGSLTKLSTGADYLVAGSGITISTGSSGNITIASTVAGSSFVAGSDTQVQFNDGGSFAGNSGLTYNKTTQALTSSIFRATTGFSGSLTKLASGDDYLVAGGNLSITTGSSGQITLATINSGTIHGVTAGTGLTGGGTSGTVTLTLSNTGSAGTYGSASTVPVFDTDAQGRVTAVTPTSIQITQGQVTNLTSDLSGKASTSTTITTSPGSGLKGGGDLSTNRTLSIDDSVVATVSGSTFSGAVKFNSGLSGSLTKLSDGVTNYLQAGSGIYIVTQSNGSILITGSSQVTLGGSNTFVQFNDGGILGGDAGLTYNKTTDTLTAVNISGSLTKLSTGADYLVAGTGIQLSTGSSGAVTITSTVAGSSLVAGSNTQVQFNDAGTFGGNSGLTYNKTTQALTGTYVVASTGFSGSLTKLSNGTDYLRAGSNITLTTGSNGSITIDSSLAPYTVSSFTNVSTVVVNHNLGLSLYDIEVFDTSYNKIIPKSVTASSSTQATITFGSLRSGFVIVGSPGGSAEAGSLQSSVYVGEISSSNQTLGQDSAVSIQNTLYSLGSDITRPTNTRFAISGPGTYRLMGVIGNSDSNVDYSGFRWYDVTNSTYIGTQAVTQDANGNVAAATTVPTAYVTISSPTVYELRQNFSGVSVTLWGSRTHVEITKVAGITSALGLTPTVGSAPYYGARAWVRFDGTGTVAIRASTNVSSITDLGIGRYTVNFTTSMNDSNYSAISTNNANEGGCYTYTASAVNVYSNNASGSPFDASDISAVVLR